MFWKDTLNAFSHFKEINMDLMQEKSYTQHEIWYNKEIKIDKKCIFYRQWYERGVRYIHDLTDEYGKILTYEIKTSAKSSILIHLYLTFME